MDFGDAAFATDVRDGVARIEQLMETELRGSDDLMTDAVLHLFRVVSSLDSMIVGEGQIAGQVKQAAELAQTRATLGPLLRERVLKSFGRSADWKNRSSMHGFT